MDYLTYAIDKSAVLSLKVVTLFLMEYLVEIVILVLARLAKAITAIK